MDNGRTVSLANLRRPEPGNRYAIATLTRANARVWLITLSAHLIVGWLGRHPHNRRPWWFAEGLREGIGDPIAPWVHPDVTLANPPPLSPIAWSPLDAAAWPDPLPDPLPRQISPRMVTRGQVPPDNPPPEPIDAAANDDGWPYPGLALGERTPPASAQECEARVLRGFRTMMSRAVDGDGPTVRTLCADIPAEVVKAAIKYADLERMRTREGRIEIPAVRSAFAPKRRDLGDWDYALAWLRVLSRVERQIVRMRAADPKFSWREIAEEVGARLARAARGTSYETVRTVYGEAIEKMYSHAAPGGRLPAGESPGAKKGQFT